MTHAERDAQPVGRVAALYRYPVKSMRGEAITEAPVWWNGLKGDRRYSFVRSDNPSGFPWLTGRQIPALIRYSPYFADGGDLNTAPVRVRTPGGADLPIESEDLRHEIAGHYPHPVHLMQLKRGAFDTAAVSFIGQGTVDAIAEWVGEPLDARRFRPNILVETLGGGPGAEDSWLGALLIIGDQPDAVRVRIIRQDVRCMMINLDPDTAVQNPDVLRTVLRRRGRCAGIYGSLQTPGTVRVGDVIRLVRD